MYPSGTGSASSSSSHRSSNSMLAGSTGLIRYASAPGLLLSSAIDSVLASNSASASARCDFFPSASSCSSSSTLVLPRHPGNSSYLGHHYLFSSGDSSPVTSESTCKVNSSTPHGGTLQRTLGPGNDLGVALGAGPSHNHENNNNSGNSSSSTCLIRQRSSPAGLLSHLTADNSFTLTRGAGSSNGSHGVSRLKSQLSFTRQESLSHISEVSESVVEGVSSDNGHQGATRSFATTGFGGNAWESSGSIDFSDPAAKRAKSIDGDMYNFNTLETQFSLPQTALEMANMEKLLNIPEDSVPCKIRAKRGCATHPRSIAERERRTRISGRLKKLQDLVPNMDKQTSYADMLDLAVQHIKTLQNQVQKLRQDMENCTCGCKPCK